VEVEDSLGDIRGHSISRITKSYLRISLVLPTSITLKVENMTVHTFPDLLAAVTQQKFVLSSFGGLMTIIFF